jgi:hypothetical protein
MYYPICRRKLAQSGHPGHEPLICDFVARGLERGLAGPANFDLDMRTNEVGDIYDKMKKRKTS